MYTDARNKRLHLYGAAQVTYGDIDMKADYILIDYGKRELLATYTLDSLGRRVGEPLFVEDGDTVRAGSIRYNFDSKKGLIEDVIVKQEEYYLSMEHAKRQPNEEIHFTHGKFTTCNLKEPHYHFFLSKAVLVPEKRIVSGPMNLWVMGVPTPLGLPFALIPQKKKEDQNPAGFIMPQYSIVSAYGMGFTDLGYYKPINERLQTTLYGTLYSRGSFGVKNRTEYNFRYKSNGYAEAGYSSFRYGWPDSSSLNAITLDWVHNQDPKANPFWTFGANIHFSSNSSNKQTLYVQNPNYFNNTLNSDVRFGRRFAKAPLSADAKLSMRQNSSTKQIDLTSPLVNFQTTSRIFPFKEVNKIFGFTYASELQNRSTFKDRYLKNGDFDSIGMQYRSGVNHRFGLSGTVSLLGGTVRLTPSVNYAQYFNFQSIQKSVTANGSLIVDTMNTAGFTHSFSSSAALTSTLYSYYRFIGKRQTLLRHVMTPTVSFVYSPNMQWGNRVYQDTSGKVIQYNMYERSIYSQGLGANSGRIALGLNNTFELKQKSDKDTITGFKKTRLIDNFFLNTDYDIFKDSMRWSDLSMNLVINPVPMFNMTLNATHSWYAWNNTTGERLSTYAIKNGQGLGRITNSSLTTTFSLTDKKYRDDLQSRTSQMMNTWNPQYQTWLTSPYQMVYFDIPWKVSFTHSLNFSLNNDTASYASRKYVPTNTLNASGYFSITENWKVTSTVLLDIENAKISNLNFTLNRNLHCWNVAINWTPIGTNQNFSVTLRGNAAALQNANFTIRKPPIVL